MVLKKIKENGYILGVIGCIQYIVITGIAMLFYSGGSHTDPNTVGYTFFGNYFSDLGLSIAINGELNIISSVLYIFATVFYGCSLIPFSLLLGSVLSGEGKKNVFGRFGLIFGCIAGFGTFLYGITPDSAGLHNLGVMIGYLGTFLMYLLFGIALLKDDTYSKSHGLLFLIAAIIYFVTLIIGFILEGNVFMTMLCQKSGKYLTMAVMIIEGILMNKNRIK
ncbi:MAG: DUF998 domain-containing protein [archaeon]|nr:DUF998 domain-containing protein [archaeon]